MEFPVVRKTLPKRMRYYHGLIDTKLLSASAGYGKLPNVFIIVILPYDPFGKNRMVYTEGKPSQELKDMLKYIEKSTADNITNGDIASVSQLVSKVKKRREVGINYMKSWEVEQIAREEGREEGQKEGKNQINQLIILLAEAGRTEDIIKAAVDTDYQDVLLTEFGLK